MRNLFILAAMCTTLCVAMPVSAQDQPAPPPPRIRTRSRPRPRGNLKRRRWKSPVPLRTRRAAHGQSPAKTPPKTAAKKQRTKLPKNIPEGPNSNVVEEIVARVNNEIITRSELDKARGSAKGCEQECKGKCTPEELKIQIEDRQKNALRDLIDQSLLVQRGKDMGISVETEVIKRLDQIPHSEQSQQHGRSGESGLQPGHQLGRL